MQRLAHGLLGLAVFAGRPEAAQLDRHDSRVTPIGKVIELLAKLESQVVKDGEEADKAHAEYQDWCKFGKKDLEYQKKTSTGEIEELTATIEKSKSDVVSETTRIEELASAIAQGEADLKAATTIRANESAEFVAAEKELVDVIDTLDRAINMLERKLRTSALVQRPVDTRNTASLLKALSSVIEAAALPQRDGQKLMALAQSHADDGDGSDEDLMGAPAAKVYESHQSNIVEVLEDMRAKAEAQLDEVRKQESGALHSYELTAQSLRDQAAADTKEMGQAKAAKATASETGATAKGDLQVADKTLDTTEKDLEEMTKGCRTAEADYEASTKSRAEELAAVRKAKEIIAESTKAAEYTAYGLVQLRQEHETSRFSLSTRADLVNFEVVNMLRQLAKKAGSATLTQLSSRVAAVIHLAAQSGEDPFAKVKTLITEIIEKLEKEAGEAAKHKEWCDKEYADTGAKKDDLSATIESLSTKIDKKSSSSMTLKDEVKETQAALANLMKAQVEADQVRRDQNEIFVQNKADLEQGLTGVRQAVKVLREYYSSDADAHGKSEAGGSIIGLLEVVESDLSRGLAEAETTEDTAQAEYQRVSMDNKLTKKTYESDVKYKTREATGLDKAVAEHKSDRESNQAELDALLEYTKSVRASCEVKPETYDDRKGRRDAEIAGLKEALEVLSSEVSLSQRDQRGLRGARHAS